MPCFSSVCLAATSNGSISCHTAICCWMAQNLGPQITHNPVHLIQLCHHRLVGIHSEAFGADKGEEDGTYYSIGDCDDYESEEVEDDQAEEAGLLRTLPEPGGVGGSSPGARNKYTFCRPETLQCKVLPLVFAYLVFGRICWCEMHVFLQGFANILS